MAARQNFFPVGGAIWYEIFILRIGLMRMEDALAHVEKRTISLPADQAGYIEAQVASGLYASASEVVRAGLRALQERDAVIDRWLHDQVAPVFDAMLADPSRAIPAHEVAQNVRAHHARRLKEQRGA
jgi:antitoxin ParD1/3/4